MPEQTEGGEVTPLNNDRQAITESMSRTVTMLRHLARTHPLQDEVPLSCHLVDGIADTLEVMTTQWDAGIEAHIQDAAYATSPPSSVEQHNSPRIERSKEWWMAKIDNEEGCESVSAGVPSPHLSVCVVCWNALPENADEHPEDSPYAAATIRRLHAERDAALASLAALEGAARELLLACDNSAHMTGCDITRDFPDPCNCGVPAALDALRAALPPVSTTEGAV